MTEQDESFGDDEQVGISFGLEDEDLAEEMEDEDEEDSSLDPRHRVLPHAPDLHARSPNKQIDGHFTSMPEGLPSSPPLWAESHMWPSVLAMRVYEEDLSGPVSLGVISVRANEEQFVAQFFDAMPAPKSTPKRFSLVPLDRRNNPVGKEIPIIIHPAHAALRHERAKRASAEGPMGIMAAPVHKPLDNAIVEALLERLRKGEEISQIDRQSVSDAQQALASERIEMARQTNEHVQTQSERLLELQAKQSQAMLEQQKTLAAQSADAQAAFFAQHTQQSEENMRHMMSFLQLQMQQAGEEHKRQMEAMRMKAEMDREREREMRRMEREEDERRRQREREERDLLEKRRWQQERAEREERQQRAEETERMRQRQHEMEMEKMRIESQQQREHSERMAELQTRMAGFRPENQLEQIIEKSTALAATLGIDIKDTIKKVLNPEKEDDGGVLLGLAETAMKEIGSTVRTSMANPKTPQIGSRVPAGMLPPPSMPSTPSAVFSPTQPEPVPVATQQTAEAPAAPSSPQPLQAPGLPLNVQRNARKALARLRAKVHDSMPEDELTDAVRIALVNTPDIISFTDAVTVKAALREAKFTDTLIERVISGLRSHPLIPEDINYGD